MTVGTERRRDWGRYLERIKDRPGWSVARLARETNIHRSTIFDWIKGGTGESVTIGSVLSIAEAAGDHPMVALQAAAGMFGADQGGDAELADILTSGLPEATQQELVEHLMRRRERDREELQRMIRLAGGRVA